MFSKAYTSNSYTKGKCFFFTTMLYGCLQEKFKMMDSEGKELVNFFHSWLTY
jgi:hypothetical protein